MCITVGKLFTDVHSHPVVCGDSNKFSCCFWPSTVRATHTQPDRIMSSYLGFSDSPSHGQFHGQQRNDDISGYFDLPTGASIPSGDLDFSGTRSSIDTPLWPLDTWFTGFDDLSDAPAQVPNIIAQALLRTGVIVKPDKTLDFTVEETSGLSILGYIVTQNEIWPLFVSILS